MDRSQVVELIVVASTLYSIYSPIRIMKALAPRANAEAGKIQSAPQTTLGKVISPIHGLVSFLPPLIYALSVLLCGLRQPKWIKHFELPAPSMDTFPAWMPTMPGGDEETKAALRVTASLSALGVGWMGVWIMKQFLGPQWAAIGVREKPAIVSTGPYGIVRHPGYTSMLLLLLCFAGMFWSYVSLVSGGIVAICFAIKMPIEEGLIEGDPRVGQAYKEYKKKVPARVIPFIW